MTLENFDINKFIQINNLDDFSISKDQDEYLLKSYNLQITIKFETGCTTINIYEIFKEWVGTYYLVNENLLYKPLKDNDQIIVSLYPYSLNEKSDFKDLIDLLINSDLTRELFHIDSFSVYISNQSSWIDFGNKGKFNISELEEKIDKLCDCIKLLKELT